MGWNIKWLALSTCAHTVMCTDTRVNGTLSVYAHVSMFTFSMNERNSAI